MPLVMPSTYRANPVSRGPPSTRRKSETRPLRTSPVRRMPADSGRRSLSAVMLAVPPRHQGRGLGRALLERVHAMSRERADSRGVTLTTESEGNVALYQHISGRTDRAASLAPGPHLAHRGLDGLARTWSNQLRSTTTSRRDSEPADDDRASASEASGGKERGGPGGRVSALPRLGCQCRQQRCGARRDHRAHARRDSMPESLITPIIAASTAWPAPRRTS